MGRSVSLKCAGERLEACELGGLKCVGFLDLMIRN